LLDRGFAFMQQLGFYAVACKSVLCCIMRSNNIKHIFLVVSQGHEQLAIAIFGLLIARSDNDNNHIFMLYCIEQAATTTFFTLYCKRAS
jgi:hypothetical protein